MLRPKKITASASAVLVMAIAITAAYVWAARHRAPTADEFSVYAAFLSRLSRDDKLSLDRFALADTTSPLVASLGESWEPAELRPHPPSKAAAPEQFTEFCGDLCAHDFMRKNLEAWELKPSSNEIFPFSVVSSNLVVAFHRIRVVSVTRCGFDLWHHRAVLSYAFDASTDGNLQQLGTLCAANGDVFLKKVNGNWQVIRISESCV